jgi:hypothetical protein
MALHEGMPVGALRILDSEPLVWSDVALDALPENTVPHVRYVLAEIARGAAYSEYGW